MTAPTVREALAAAASLDKAKVTPFYRQSIKTGDGFVRYGGRSRASNGFGWIDKWEVWLAIPQELAAAERWLDANVGPLTEAIAAQMVIASVTPSELVLGSTTVNGVIFAGSVGA